MTDSNVSNHRNIATRLSRIEGQIRGIRNMVEEERDCEDIIIQLSAVSSAITNTAKVFMEDHMAHCVVEGIEKGETEQTIESLRRVFEQFAKMK